MESLKYQFVDHKLTSTQQERVLGWVKTGSKNHPVAVFGASAELFLHSLQTAEVTPYDIFGQIEWDWQQEILDAGKHLHYATLIYTGIKRASPPFAREIREKYADIFESMKDLITFKGARGTSIDYANTMALTDAFIRDFGVFRNRREIWVMTTTWFPSLAKENTKHPATYQLDVLEFTEEDKVEREELGDQNLTLQQVRNKLAACFKRRGIIWYYNDKIFQHEVIPSIEGESEIIILPTKPLTLEVISGIEILGEEEKRLLLPKQNHRSYSLTEKA